MDKFTILDNIVRYIYKETDSDENKKIKYTLYQNPQMREECRCLKATCMMLECLRMSPCKEIVKNVISYSAKINTFGQSDLVQTELMKN